MIENIRPAPDLWRWRKATFSEANGNSDCVELGWRKSSFSQANGNSNCVELASTVDAVRDSKNPAGPVLTVRALPTLLAEIKTGRFDR